MRIAIVVLLSWPAGAQGPLSLKEAVRVALDKHPSMEAAKAQARAVQTRVRQARSGYLPKLNYQESWQRSDNPVFVFSSLLTQHQFTERNFAIGPLNRPDAINNFQSQMTLDQVLWDGRQTRSQIRSAELGRDMAGEDQRRAQMDVIASVIRAYFGAALSQENLNVAKEAVRSAEADLSRAEAVRAAGMATDADVLAIHVHLAAVREQEIRRRNELDVARAALNEALGLALDTPHDLSTPLAVAKLADAEVSQREESARQNRPEVRQNRLASSLAETQSEASRAALWPQVFFRVAFEADRRQFVNQGGANWFAGAFVRWNVFNGYADKARIDEMRELAARAKAQERQTDGAVRLQVRRAWSDLNAAQERLEVAAAAVAMAEENLRIVKNRYEAGLTNVTELLRSETALMETRVRRLAAIHDQRLAAASLELAAGTLNADSEVLN
jgi:outer membrane protein TolC